MRKQDRRTLKQIASMKGSVTVALTSTALQQRCVHFVLVNHLSESGPLWIPLNHLASTNMVVRYQPTNGFNWFPNHWKYLLDDPRPPRLGKAWGDWRSGSGTGIGRCFPYLAAVWRVHIGVSYRFHFLTFLK